MRQASEIVELLRQLSADMMRPGNLPLNALVNGDVYGDGRKIANDMKETRASLAAACGMTEAELVEAGFIPRELSLPIQECGKASNIVCELLLNRGERNRYDYSTEPTIDLATVRSKLGLLKWSKPYLLRVDCHTHSYVLILQQETDRSSAYLVQCNLAACMKLFTLDEWMSSRPSRAPRCAHTHAGLLEKVGTGPVQSGTPNGRILTQMFSINPSDTRTYTTAFEAKSYRFTLREIDIEQARMNLYALYRRAGLPPPTQPQSRER
jgi:hypothetical protein